MRYILVDARNHHRFRPLTFTRAVADLFMGMQTFRERWEHALEESCGIHTQDYLQPLYPREEEGDFIAIDPLCIPRPDLVEEIKSLKMRQVLRAGGDWVAYRAEGYLDEAALDEIDTRECSSPVLRIADRWDLFARNGEVLELDFALLTRGRESADIDPGNRVVGAGSVFLEEGAVVTASILNPTKGPIYIGRDAEVMEGSLIRGGLALMDRAILKMGTKIYGACSFGRGSKVGGEVNNSVIFPYSNKGHEGFLGNSVLGSWCNLGADTNTSNMKNNYAKVKLWDYDRASFVSTGLQFCGLIMGDHSKSGIDTMFNTGTVVGVNANIFGSGFPRNFIPSFSWGGAGGFKEYRTDKALETARAMMARRSIEPSPEEIEVLNHVFELTRAYRNF